MQNHLNQIVVEGVILSAVTTTESSREPNEVLWFIKTEQGLYEIQKPVEVVKKSDDAVVQSSNQKPDVIKVVRYFRRWNRMFNQPESSGGVTAINIIDYKRGKMYVYPAFCSDDENFSKQIGLHHANSSYASDVGIVFEFSRDMSIAQNIAAAIEEKRYSYTTTNAKHQAMLRRRFEIATNDLNNYITAAIA